MSLNDLLEPPRDWMQRELDELTRRGLDLIDELNDVTAHAARVHGQIAGTYMRLVELVGDWPPDLPTDARAAALSFVEHYEDIVKRADRLIAALSDEKPTKKKGS